MTGDTTNELNNSDIKKYSNTQSFLDDYKSVLKNHLKHIYEDVKDSDTGNIGSNEFALLLANYLISQIDLDTLIV